MLLITDTSPLISLILIEKLDLLEKLYGDYCIPNAVWHELTNHNVIKGYLTEIQNLFIKLIESKHYYPKTIMNFFLEQANEILL